MVILRDGRKLVGVMRSYDQFGEQSGGSHGSQRTVFSDNLSVLTLQQTWYFKIQ